MFDMRSIVGTDRKPSTKINIVGGVLAAVENLVNQKGT